MHAGRRLIACLLTSLLPLGCSESGTSPSSTAPRVTAIAPSSGTTLGGTSVTITGQNFVAGAVVTIGGAPAASVAVVSATTITANTPQHASATSDVVVTVGAQSGALARGFTFVAPPPATNQAPVVSSIAVQGSGPREPSQYATVGESVAVSASVTDAEASPSDLSYSWTSDAGGDFSGSGPSVTWRAPADLSDTPRTVTLSLTVTERYSSVDASGLPISAENRATGTSAVRVHNSAKEVSDLAVTFLLDFSRQLDPLFVMRNFTPTCGGTADELNDVRNNQANFLITSYKVGPAATSVHFMGRCPFRNVFGDACAFVPVEWHSTIKSNGKAIFTAGTDQVTAVFENDQWRLCASDYDEVAASPLLPPWLRFKR